ncbi:MAG: protein-glutamate O-methyltransferase CheR [Dehalococcoidia bacterium]|nr:protein-glutamate O-methyltransferase CheR [Dehalococcoidia bacterium]
MDDVTYAQLQDQLQRLLGLDLTAYKPQQMRRRITTFVQREAGGDTSVFLMRLQTDAALLAATRDMLTINVTDFFRDESQWDLLASDILPPLTAGRRGLRVWSAGCSRGQEPLSLAIALDRAGVLASSRILATDFDREVLAKAKLGGPYSREEMRGVPTADRAKYFQETPAGTIATRRLLSPIRFAEVNLLRDQFERSFDLIVCRNVMIYFENHVKSDLVRRFREALAPEGMLFIGATEALLGSDLAGFQRVGGNFYRRVSEDRRNVA